MRGARGCATAIKFRAPRLALFLLVSRSTSPPTCRHAVVPATAETGLHGVRWHSYGTWSPEFTAGGKCVWLGTFNSPEEAVRTYNAACWCFGCDHMWLNLPDITLRVEPEFLMRPPNLQTCEDRGATSTRS
jgi:hypothetical protein